MKAPAFQIYVADFDMDTAAWDNEEVGAYVRLLFYQWANEAIPDDPARLAKIARCSRTKFRKIWLIISQKFVPKSDGFLINLRLERTRHEKQQYIEGQQESGKKGAEKRWKSDSKPNGDPIGKPNGETIALQSSSSSSSNTNTSTEKNISPYGDTSPEPSGDTSSNGHCPHQEIIALYHQLLPSLSRVKEWTEERQKILRSRWREKSERQTLAWWGDFFRYVATCDFLMGKTKDTFACDLEWLIRPKNFVKVIEGRYENRTHAVSASSMGIMNWAKNKRKEIEDAQ